MKSKFGIKGLILTGALTLTFGLGVGGGVGYAATNYFSGNVDALKERYDEKIEKSIADADIPHGAMQSYLTELYPKLEGDAEAYYQESFNKWTTNQGTLSEEEQAEIDASYNEALAQVKANIDANFKEYGGY